MQKQRGSTLISVMVVLAVVAIYVGAAYSFTLTLRRNVDRSVHYRHVVAVADGSLQYAFGHWRQICRSMGRNVPTTAAVAAIPLPTADLFPSLSDRVTTFTASRSPNPSDGSDPFTIANYQVQALSPEWAPTAAPVDCYGRSAEDVSVYYRATVDVSVPQVARPVSARLSQVFRKRSECPWDYAFFYTGYLDIHSGGAMVVRGPVHTMSNAYLGRAALTFTDQFSFAGALSIRPGGAGKHPGDPGSTDSAPPTFPPQQPSRTDTGKIPFGIEPYELSTTDGSSDNDSYREVIEKRQGPISDDPFSANGEKNRMYDRADARITIDASNNVEIRNRNDVALGPTSAGVDKDIYDVIVAALTTNEEIRDNRESTAFNVRLASLDVATINSALRPAGGTNTGPVAGRLVDKTFNRLIYLTDTSYDRSAGQFRALRLRNGEILPPGGLCVATDNPVYIQGDYNTGRAAGNEPPSNRLVSRDPSGSTAGGYEWQPSVVYADAINLLSNAWSDANSFTSLSSRVPSHTTYNTSFVAGVRLIATNETGYSGGAENFPRFLESWNGVHAVTIYGTMVQLFESKQADRPWAYGSPRYTAPIREYNFDERFADALPPGTFRLVTYDRLAWTLN